MSGGHFHYSPSNLTDIAYDIREQIKSGEWEWRAETVEELWRAVEAVEKARIYIHRVDYLLSGDDSEDSFRVRLGRNLEDFERSYNTERRG